MAERTYGKYRHHKYTWQNPFTAVSHRWEFVGPLGAVHFHVSVMKDSEFGPTAGLEFHHTGACNYRPGTAPDHIDCPLTGGPCWHDGTSLYAIETLWPIISAYLRSGEHRAIFDLLEREADQHFEGYEIAIRQPSAA